MADGGSATTTKRQESLRDAFSSRLSRLNTFAASVLVLLLFLFVAAELQIREYEREITDAAHARTHAGLKMASSLHALKNLRRSFFNLVPRPQKLARKPREESFASELMSRTFSASIEPVGALDEETAATQPGGSEKAPPRDEHLYEKVLSDHFLSDGASWDEKLRMFAKAEEQLRGDVERARRSFDFRTQSPDAAPKAQALKILQEYEEKARTVTLQRANVAAAVERIRKIRATKESIPTPFGSFQIDPRLALLAMAFAALCAYVFFNVSARGALAVGREFAESLSSSDRRDRAVPTPAWFFTDSAVVREVTIRPSRNWTAAAPLHVVWLLFALLICFESWRWGAAHSLMVTHSYLIYAVLLVPAFAAVALCVGFLRPQTVVLSPERGQRLLAARVNRRQAIFGAAIAAVAVGGRAVLRKWLRKGRPLPVAALAGEVSVPLYLHPHSYRSDQSGKWKPNLIAHSRTGVVHHIEVCAHHLPKGTHRVLAGPRGVVHRAWEAAILYQASIEIERLNSLTFGAFRDSLFREQERLFEEEDDGARRTRCQ